MRAEACKPKRWTCGMTNQELLQSKRSEILKIAKRHGATNVRVFGSTVRGEAGPESDLDVLVDLEPGRSLFDLGGLLVDLQDLLQCRVDLTTEAGLHWYIRDRVVEEAVLL